MAVPEVAVIILTNVICEFPTAVNLAMMPTALVAPSILPFVFPRSFHPPIAELPRISAPARDLHCSLPMFEPVDKIASVFTPIGGIESAHSIEMIVNEIARIMVTYVGLQFPISVGLVVLE